MERGGGLTFFIPGRGLSKRWGRKPPESIDFAGPGRRVAELP